MIGLGAASLGAVCGNYYTNLAGLPRYFAAISKGELPIARHTPLSREDAAKRAVLLGTKFIHVSRTAFNKSFGLELEDAMEPMLSRFRRLGVWTVDEDGIHLTQDGMQIISEIWAEIILANLADAATPALQPDRGGRVRQSLIR